MTSKNNKSAINLGIVNQNTCLVSTTGKNGINIKLQVNPNGSISMTFEDILNVDVQKNTVTFTKEK